MATEVLEQAALGAIPEVAVDQPSAPVVLPEITADTADPTALAAVVEKVQAVISLPNTFAIAAITRWQNRAPGSVDAVLDRMGPVGDALQHAGNYLERLGVERSINLARLVTGGVRTVLTAAGWVAPSVAGGGVLDAVAEAVQTHATAVAESVDHTHHLAVIGQPSTVHTLPAMDTSTGTAHSTNMHLVSYTETVIDNPSPTRIASHDNPWSGRPDNIYDWARQDLEASLREDGIPEDQIKHLIHDDRNIQPILDAYEKQNADALKARNGNPAGWLYADESYKTGDAKTASDHVADDIAHKLGIEPKVDPGSGDTGDQGGDGGTGGDQGGDGKTDGGQDQGGPGGGLPSAAASASASAPAVQPSAPSTDVPASGAPSTHPTGAPSTHPTPHVDPTSAAPVVDAPTQPGTPQNERLIVTAPWGTRYYADYVLQEAALLTGLAVMGSELRNMYRKSDERYRNPGLRLYDGDIALAQAELARQIHEDGREDPKNTTASERLERELQKRADAAKGSARVHGVRDGMAALLAELRDDVIAWVDSTSREERSDQQDADAKANRARAKARAEKSDEEREIDLRAKSAAAGGTTYRHEPAHRLGKRVVGWSSRDLYALPQEHEVIVVDPDDIS